MWDYVAANLHILKMFVKSDTWQPARAYNRISQGKELKWKETYLKSVQKIHAGSQAVWRESRVYRKKLRQMNNEVDTKETEIQ